MIDDTVPVNAVSIVKLPAEVDLATAGALRDQLLAAINRDGRHLVVDATEVTFIDSSGVNALVRARERAERIGGSIHVVTTSRSVLRVLEVTQLDHVMSVLPTMDDVMACLSRPALIHSCRGRRQDRP